MSVTLKYRDQMVRNTSKIIPRPIILAFSVSVSVRYQVSVCRDHNIMDLLIKEHHEITAETGIRQMMCYIDLHNPFTSAFKHNRFCLVKFVGWRTLNRKE